MKVVPCCTQSYKCSSDLPSPALCRFEIWDLAGQANLRPSWSNYYQATNAIIVVADSTDRWVWCVCTSCCQTRACKGCTVLLIKDAWHASGIHRPMPCLPGAAGRG